jgi:PLD-like domain
MSFFFIRDQEMQNRAVAFANNDIAYIFWRVEKKIPNCLGFSISRIASDGNQGALPAYVGFDKGSSGNHAVKMTTENWPVQAFQWKDVFAVPGKYRYEVTPMLGPDATNLIADKANAIMSNEVNMTGNFGDTEAYFNVGLISTQSIAKQLRKLVEEGKYSSPEVALKGEITKANSNIRAALSGDVLSKGVLSLLTKASQTGGSCHAALYELTDRQLISAIKKLSVTKQIELCLSNADSNNEFDGTNEPTRADLKASGVQVVDRFVPSNSIGHNKFVVYSDPNGDAQSILTGSTNWTSTGLCSQTNNSIIIHNEEVAQGYKQYWDWLVWDAGQKPSQGKDIRQWNGGGPISAKLQNGTASIWFSPNTAVKTKNAEIAPPDLAEVYSLIAKAKFGILFLAFKPGSPNVMEAVSQKAQRMKDVGKPFFVRGAVTDATPLGNFVTFLTKRDATVAPDVVVSGVAGVPDNFGYWEQELYKIGHAVIHDKILVIDPFSNNPIVITGSHNLGYKASYSNDENLVIIRGNRSLSEAYATHVLDVTNHFSWRYKLTAMHKSGKLKSAWSDLDETDGWQDKYFVAGGNLSRDEFFFSS